MKSSLQPSKPSSSSSNSKSKRSSKERDKRKSQGASLENANHLSSEKGSPIKDSSTRQYAGIDGDSLAIYAEQTAFEHLSEEISNTLTEDINYRLRYIINDALMKARLSGRNAVTSSDLRQTFENLNLSRVYGAPTHPNWVPLENQGLFCLEDNEVNLVEIAEEENIYLQPGQPILTRSWLPESKEIGKPFRNYFTTTCQMVVSTDPYARKMALKNISENSRIGPITEWFYNFAYILLSKDITYDCLTLRALELVRVLENSVTCSVNVSEKLLKLLVRLLLQRLLKSVTTNEILKPMCSILAVLCNRVPLREFVIAKILQKLLEVCQTYALSIVTITHSLGIDAITEIFLPNINLFLTQIVQTKHPDLSYSILELYNVLSKEDVIHSDVYNAFYEIFGDAMVIFCRPLSWEAKAPDPSCKREINFVKMKTQLMKRRRKYIPNVNSSTVKISIDDVFEMPPEGSEVRKKINDHHYDNSLNEPQVILGKTSLLLPVLKQKKWHPKCCDYSLLWYNF